MSNAYHTKIPFAGAANASVFNAPLGQLDSWLFNVPSGIMIYKHLTVDPPPPAARSLYIKNNAAYFQNSAGEVFNLAGAKKKLIALTTLGADTPTITISGISQTYRHLWLRTRLRKSVGAAAGLSFVQLNGDTGFNYCSVSWNGTIKTTRIPTDLQGALDGPPVAPIAQTANVFAVGDIVFYDYANTTHYKNMTLAGADAGAVNGTFFGGATWLSTAAITEIKFVLGVGNYIAGSAYELWGIT